jgi:hypothetical protein
VGKQWAAVLVVGALLAGACGTSKSNSSGGQAPIHPGVALATPTTRRAPRTTTPTTVPAFSFDNSVPPPKLINTGTNYVAILKSLDAYSNWLAAHRPEPALVDAFVASGTRLHDSYVQTLTTLRDRSERFIEHRSGEDRYAIVSATPDAVSANVTQRIVSHRVVDSAGRTVKEALFDGDSAYRVLAVKTGERWYIASTVVTQAPRQVP